MKENEFISIIKKIAQNTLIGDDCAYLKELGIVISQDNFIENVHFKNEWYTAFQLGYKAASINISDILASGGVPKYLTVGLSLPSYINSQFIEDFYKGVLAVSDNIEIIGGDITGSSDNIFVSITAIGIDSGRRIASRKNAKPNYIVITKGMHGSSSLGLYELLNNIKDMKHVKSHILPTLEYKFSEQIASNITTDYAMMDTSDGLADAIYKIAESSNVTIDIDYNKIPHEPDVPKDNVLFGGEDYKLVAAIPRNFLKFIDDAVIIGYVKEFDGTYLNIDNVSYKNYDELNTFNHFGE